MKIHVFLITLALWWAIGSIHTAAMTSANVLVNRNINAASKFRYVIFGGPPVWSVCLFAVAIASFMSARYKFKNRHVEKGQG